MGNFYKPIQCQNTTKTKCRKSWTVVTGECSNNMKVSGMAGIWSGAFIWRQLWGGETESRSGEWESFAAALCSPPDCRHTHMHTQMQPYTFTYSTHSDQTWTSDTLQRQFTAAKTSADTQGLCPWLQEAKTGEEGSRRERNREKEQTREKESGEGCVRAKLSTEKQLWPKITISKNRVKTQKWGNAYTKYKLHIIIYSYL